MYKKISISIFFLLSFAITNGAWAACSISKWPPPELVKYINDIKTELAQIRSQAGAQNKCNGKPGTFSAERRFLETLDRIDLNGSMLDTAVSLPQDMALDFLYNVTFAVEGKSRWPVTNQGKLFKDLESNAVKTIENITNICALDVSLSSWGTPESRISEIIGNNRKIERFFWMAATWDPTLPEGLEKYSDLLDSIRINYSPEQTNSCNSEYNIENVASEIMDRIWNITSGTKNGHKAWEEAIALFQGKNKGTAEYVKLQSRLLQTEMARQGLSQNAKKAMLKNLTCPEQKTDPTSSPEERTKADYDCQRQYVTGLETITQGLKPKIFQSKTTDEFLVRTLTYSREKNQVSTYVGWFWGALVKLKSADEPLNDKILNDLVNIHLELLTTIEALEKWAIPKMQENCKKWSPNVECPRNLDY
jgi:type II secretory pathway pseudopilin PulG